MNPLLHLSHIKNMMYGLPRAKVLLPMKIRAGFTALEGNRWQTILYREYLSVLVLGGDKAWLPTNHRNGSQLSVYIVLKLQTHPQYKMWI